MQGSEKMNLTASARLIMQLGEQLIEDELVALLELIKNAYDADANNVDVLIDTNTVTPYGKGRIEIKDDGNGMIPSIVRNSFLRLSTSFKEEEKSSIYYHRRVLGKKGIGRLSFQRLGNYISVETVPNIERYEKTELLKKEDKEFINEYSKINIDIDWSEFPIDMDFSDIMATVKYEKDIVVSYGTKIVIQGIKNLNFWDMDKKKEEKLKNELLNMMDPFQKNLKEKRKDGFSVLLKINDIPYSVKPIEEDLLDELYDSKVTFKFKNWKFHIEVERQLKYIMQRRESTTKSQYNNLRDEANKKKLLDSGTLLYNIADYSVNKEYNNPSMGDLYVFTDAKSKKKYAGMLISQECSIMIRMAKYPDDIKRKADELLLLLFDIVEVSEESIKGIIKKLDDCIWPIKVDGKICLLQNTKRSMYISPEILDLCGLNASGKANIQFEEEGLEYKSVYSREYYKGIKQKVETKIADTVERVIKANKIKEVEDTIKNMIISLAYGVDFNGNFEMQRICRIDEKQTLHTIHEYLNGIAKIGLQVIPNM